MNAVKKTVYWFKNYFYYYKIRVIIALIVIAIALLAIFGVKNENYDYKIYLCLSENTSSELLHSVQNAASLYAKDINGDGKANVQVIDLSYSVTSADTQNAQSKAVLLAGEMQAGGNYVFIYDDHYFDLALKDILDESKSISLDGSLFNSLVCSFIQNEGVEEFEMPNVSVSMRKAPKNDDKNRKETYEKDAVLFDNIIKNNTQNEEVNRAFSEHSNELVITTNAVESSTKKEG